MEDDTIVAIATAPGESAVAVLRLSGPRSLALAARHFRGKRSPERSPSHRILFGTFVDGEGAPLDSILLSVFRAPHSYTGEDVAEISSHGGAAIPSAILAALLRSGARPARPGEFTERAFRNGKIDLAQAEAVASLVRARSDRAARAARSTLGGEITRRVQSLDAAMIRVLAEVEARIDFPSDVSEGIDAGGLAERCAEIAAELGGWLEAIPAARKHEGGLRVVLAGPPNVGKSSLMNALVGYERAIVSEAPGTTRDTVEAAIALDGVELLLTDTAGLRGSRDPIERLGMERTGRALETADAAILVLDASDPEESFAGARETFARIGGNGGTSVLPVLVAWNKVDLARDHSAPRPKASLAGAHILAEVETVAIDPGGTDALRGALHATLPALLGGHSGTELPTTNARQEALVREALDALRRAERALRAGDSFDLIAVDLTDARRALGEVVGRGVDHDVVAAIFSQFCIGK